jgi:hypothetical protein
MMLLTAARWMMPLTASEKQLISITDTDGKELLGGCNYFVGLVHKSMYSKSCKATRPEGSCVIRLQRWYKCSIQAKLNVIPTTSAKHPTSASALAALLANGAKRS